MKTSLEQNKDIDKDGVTHVTLDNTTQMLKIDYATDNAGPLTTRRK